MPTSEPIAHYHDLITRGTLAADSQERLDSLQKHRGLTFGSRPSCTVLRPRFLTPDQYRFLRDRVAVLAGAFRTAFARALGDAAFRAGFGLTDWEERLLGIEPGFTPPNPVSRFDAFYHPSDNTLQFTEYNTETPAGAAYSDALSEVFYGLPVFQEFQRKFHVLPIPAKPGTLHALLDVYKQWRGGTAEPPRVAILDWREVPTYSEFVLFYDYFQAMGVEARIVDPRDCEFVNGKLMAGDYHITLIYKRVLISELIERCGVDSPVVNAVAAGAVCFANTFRCKVLAKKSSFAVLSDERNAPMFTPAEQKAIADHIPWTRTVTERKTVHCGRTVDLIPFAIENRETLVLKPNDDYGGKGVVLGWTVTDAEWAAAVKTALGEPYVVQEKIRLPYEPFPSFHDGALHVIDRLMDTNPYVAFGEFVHGCLTRISTEQLLNVTAGGGSTVPTFLVEKR